MSAAVHPVACVNVTVRLASESAQSPSVAYYGAFFLLGGRVLVLIWYKNCRGNGEEFRNYWKSHAVKKDLAIIIIAAHKKQKLLSVLGMWQRVCTWPYQMWTKAWTNIGCILSSFLKLECMNIFVFQHWTPSAPLSWPLLMSYSTFLTC